MFTPVGLGMASLLLGALSISLVWSVEFCFEGERASYSGVRAETTEGPTAAKAAKNADRLIVKDIGLISGKS
jgi:hypothetical protein